MADSPDYSGHCMIALYPDADTAGRLAVPDGLPPDDLHTTVVYLGAAADIDPHHINTLVAAAAQRPPITANIAGHARFTGGEQDVCVALIDSPDLTDLHHDLTRLLDTAGIPVPREHGYTAHTTLAYLQPDDDAPISRLPARAATYTALSVVHGTTRTDHPFRATDPATAAREAFTAAWCATGAPTGPRAIAAARAATALVEQHPNDPRVLEVTVDLARLEGTWAVLFGRRQALQAEHADHVHQAWRALFDDDALRGVVTDLRRNTLGILEADADPAITRQTVTAAAAEAILRAIGAYDLWDRLRKALRRALRAGRADGIASAVAIAAARTRRNRALDWDTAFRDAYDSLTGTDDSPWADTAPWLARLIHRAAAAIARALTNLPAGTDLDAMLAAARGAIDDPDTAGWATDWAMTAAADDGTLALYRQYGALTVDVITVGDTRVCPHCEDAENTNPHPIDEAPQLPLHPLCRCCYSADLDLAPFEAWFP